MSVIVDSNVILDVLTEDKQWFEWSSTKLIELAEANQLIINKIIYSEISIRFSRIEDLEQILAESGLILEAIPKEAAFLAGKCFVKYKKQSGVKSSPLPDFFIGAHASLTKRKVITRDARRFAHYFPKLQIIQPSS